MTVEVAAPGGDSSGEVMASPSKVLAPLGFLLLVAVGWFLFMRVSRAPDDQFHVQADAATDISTLQLILPNGNKATDAVPPSWKPAASLTVTSPLRWRTFLANELNREEVSKLIRHLKRVLQSETNKPDESLWGKDDPNVKPLVVYNKVGKCGSRTMVRLISQLATRNKFVAVGSVYGNKINPSSAEQEAIRSIVTRLPRPALYHRHVHLMGFTRPRSEAPVLFNIVREPLERAVSAYYFKRFGDGQKEGMRGTVPEGTLNTTFDQCVNSGQAECSKMLWYIIPYFCGVDQVCKKPSRRALQRAQRAVKERYLFVGLTEYMKESVQALEALLPGMFSGASEILLSQKTESRKSTATHHKIPASKSTHAKLLKMPALQLEMQFYRFVRERFYLKLKQLKIPIHNEKD